MSHPILTINPSATDSNTTKKSQMHLLPCRIHHDGPIHPTSTYWQPRDNSKDDGIKTAYLRGRKLQGRTVALPAGYYGSVSEKGDVKAEVPARAEAETGEEEDDDLQEMPAPLEVAPLRSSSTFGSFVVWSHENPVDGREDPYVRSIEEWTSFAEKIHAYPAPSTRK